MTSRLIGEIPGVRHGITGRLPGRAPAEGNVGYGAPRDRDAAWGERQRWLRAGGVDPRTVTTVHQVHGAVVARVDRGQRGRGGPLGSQPLGEGDALMTRDAGVAVMTLHADCMPILLADPENLAVCAIHAGWRGTVAGIAEEAVAAMRRAYGSDPACLVAYLGPSIGGCCYEVGDEVLSAWRDRTGEDGAPALVDGPRRAHLDLVVANALLLRRAGVTAGRIEVAETCTRCHGDRWFSHRGQGAHTGRFAAFIGIAPADDHDDDWLKEES